MKRSGYRKGTTSTQTPTDVSKRAQSASTTYIPSVSKAKRPQTSVVASDIPRPKYQDMKPETSKCDSLESSSHASLLDAEITGSGRVLCWSCKFSFSLDLYCFLFIFFPTLIIFLEAEISFNKQDINIPITIKSVCIVNNFLLAISQPSDRFGYFTYQTTFAVLVST